MNRIMIDIDTEHGFHPPGVIVRENGKTLLDMPADEFIGWVKDSIRLRDRREENNEGDRPSEDSLSSDSTPAAGG